MYIMTTKSSTRLFQLIHKYKPIELSSLLNSALFNYFQIISSSIIYESERMNQQLNNSYSFISSIINFLQKNLTQFHKALITYSFVLKHLHTKSTNLLLKTNSNHELNQHLHRAFFSFIQTFEDEYHQLDQRARFLNIIQITIHKLQQQINSSIIYKPKHKLHHYTSRILRLNRKKKRQYLYNLVQQIRKHEKLTITWKDNLENITSQTTKLLWKLFSYSPYKYKINCIKTPSVDDSPDVANGQPSSPIDFSSGDQIRFQSKKGNSPQEVKKGQQQVSSSNNALIIPIHFESHNDENQSIDESIVEKNRLYDDFLADPDNRWINLIKQTSTHLSISTDQSSNDSASIIPQDKRKNSLHLSDISCTTDYYSQNESDY